MLLFADHVVPELGRDLFGCRGPPPTAGFDIRGHSPGFIALHHDAEHYCQRHVFASHLIILRGKPAGRLCAWASLSD